MDGENNGKTCLKWDDLGGPSLFSETSICTVKITDKSLTFASQKKNNDLYITSHTIHVWYIHLHLPQKSTIHVGKYTIRPMDGLGALAVYCRTSC